MNVVLQVIEGISRLPGMKESWVCHLKYCGQRRETLMHLLSRQVYGSSWSCTEGLLVIREESVGVASCEVILLFQDALKNRECPPLIQDYDWLSLTA